MDSAYAYLPQDRRFAQAQGRKLPTRASGAVLFADISGFTPLADSLVRQFGPHRGADRLTRRLNEVYTLLIDQIERFGGSVIGFSGDAITCWFGEQTGKRQASDGSTAVLRAAVAALAMQSAMQAFAAIPLAIKIAIAAGDIQRFVVGDPDIQLFDVLIGDTLERMAAAESMATKGEVVADEAAVAALNGQAVIGEWRNDHERRRGVAVLTELHGEIPTSSLEFISETQQTPQVQIDMRSWILPAVYERLTGEHRQFLAELRPATALFLKFSGLDFDNDPQAGKKLDQYVRHVQHILAKYDAALIQLTTGDKGSYLYAAFGAPVTHDDDVRRAIAAALELRNQTAPTSARPETQTECPRLDVQIGISQGTMRVGPYGSARRQTYGVLGDETIVAARLMSHAACGEILVSEAIFRAMQYDFVFESLGLVQLKGKYETQSVYALLSRRRSTDTSLPHHYAAPLVGREHELALLQTALEQALGGEGRIVRIEGSPGLGKSRLAATFLQQAQARGVETIVAICQTSERDFAYSSMRQVIRLLLGLAETASAQEQIEQLADIISAFNPDWLVRLPLLGDLLGIEITDNPTIASFEPQLRQEALNSLLIDLLQANAHQRPRLILLEDVHWMDEASQTVLLALGRALNAMSILVLLVQRPAGGYADAFLASLADLPQQMHIILGELASDSLAQLLSHRLGAPLTRLAFELIQAQTQGNPFFSEELCDFLCETKRLILDQQGAWDVAEPIRQALQAAQCLVYDPNERQWRLSAQAALGDIDLGAPHSVHGIVLSRIDRLPDAAKMTLKVASAIGRIFPFELLKRVMQKQAATTWQGIDDPALHIAELLARDFARLDRPDPAAAYIFKHAITQEVTYNTLLEDQRQTLHGLIASCLEETQPEAIERLAFHYARGATTQPEIYDKALYYLDLAAQRAQRDYANETALVYLEQALSLEARWEWIKRKVEVLDLLGRRQQQLSALEQLAAAPAAYQFDRLLLTSKYYESISEYSRSEALVTEMLQQARQAGDAVREAQCLNQQGMLAWRQGNYTLAEARYFAALFVLDENEALTEINRKGAIAAESHYGVGLVYRQQGKLEASQHEFENALQINRQLGNRQQEARSLSALGSVERQRRNFAAAHRYDQQALTIGETIGDRAGVGASLLHLAQDLRELGEHDQAESLLHKALDLQKALGNRWWQANICNELGILYLTVGEMAQAHQCLEQGLALCRQLQQDAIQAYILGNLGLILIEMGNITQAIAMLQEALAMASAQGDVDLEASCLNDLALAQFCQANYSQAIAHAEASYDRYSSLKLEMLTTSCLAIKAASLLALGQQEDAGEIARQALQLLDAYHGEGPYFPQRDYWMCYETLHALQRNDLANHAVALARQHLLQQVSRIQNPQRRASFLDQVSFNRAIYQTIQAGVNS